MKRDQTKHIPKYMNYFSSLAYSVTGFYIFLAKKISLKKKQPKICGQ
jgi:hypothetical protein